MWELKSTFFYACFFRYISNVINVQMVPELVYINSPNFKFTLKFYIFSYECRLIVNCISS